MPSIALALGRSKETSEGCGRQQLPASLPLFRTKCIRRKTNVPPQRPAVSCVPIGICFCLFLKLPVPPVFCFVSVPRYDDEEEEQEKGKEGRYVDTGSLSKKIVPS